MGYKGRDVEVVWLGDRCIVAACDSCGAVGSKELDAVNVPSHIVGRFTARVALLEVLSTGAKPIMITVTSCNEPQPTSKHMLEGIKDELDSLHLNSLPLVVSTEKNMPTRQTSLGISVVGVCERSQLRIAATAPGDEVYCLGIPKVGPEVYSPVDPEIIQGKHIRELLAAPQIHDIVTVGSQGIYGEAQLLAENTGGRFEPETGVEVDLYKSAGPATCLIFTIPPQIRLSGFHSTPFCKVGSIAK